MNLYLLLIAFQFLIFAAVHLHGESRDLIYRRLSDDNTPELRYATFGTSRTWGAFLQNRTIEAYPWLLSQNTKNYAIRGSDARYPSMCLQSMLSNSTYDVIIMEYDRYSKNLHSCIIEMIRRLRQRFPKATIILTNIWLLWDINVVTKGKIVKFPRWLSYKKHLSPSEILSLAQKNNSTFMYNPLTYKSTIISEKIAEIYDVKLYSWFGKNEHSSVKRDLLSRLPYFADFLHWNNVGHLRVATDIYRIILESKAQKSNDLGAWTENDVCSLWIQSGVIENKSYFKFPPNVVMKKYDERKGKFALELPLDKESTTFEIENPFEKPKNFYLTYMVSHPNRLYPKMGVVLRNAAPSNTTTNHFIDPFEDHGYPAHFPVLKGVGVVHPGINYLTFTPMEVTEFPFRIIGYSISEVPLDQNNLSSSYSWYF